MRTYYRPMGDKLILHVLHHIRQEIVRDGLDGLEHVDALLRQKGADPDTLPVPRKWPKRFAGNELRGEIVRALRSGPKTCGQVAEALVAKHPDWPLERARKSVGDTLYKMGRAGTVRREGKVWALT